MAYQRERDLFVHKLLDDGFAYGEIRAILRDSAKLKRLEEAHTSGYYPAPPYHTPAQDERSRLSQSEIDEHCQECGTCDRLVWRSTLTKGECQSCRTSRRLVSIVADRNKRWDGQQKYTRTYGFTPAPVYRFECPSLWPHLVRDWLLGDNAESPRLPDISIPIR